MAPESDPREHAAATHADAPRIDLAAMALLAGAGIALQLSLTRLFSLVVWYHFAFLAISIAMLGLSLGGVLAARRARERASTPASDAARGALAASGATLVLLLALPRMPFHQSILASAGQLSLFVLLVLLVLAPFTATGFAIARVLGASGPRAGALYGADLAGSGIAGAVSVLAMDHLGGGAGAAAVAALCAALAAVGFFVADGAPRELTNTLRGPGTRGALGLAMVCVGYAVIARDPMHPLVYARNAKVFPRVERAQTYERRCTSIACVDFFHNPLHLGLWGREGVDQGLPEQVGIVIDGWAVTSILRGTRDPQGRLEASHPLFDRLPTAFPHQVRRAARRPVRTALVIGAGGGLDVRSALHHGVESVDAVEINPSIVAATRGRFGDFSGRIFDDPRVRLVLGEGRSVLERLQDRYDLVQLSGVDTYAASQAGAFALTENHLYTVEALRAYLQRLTPDGTLTLTRWLYHPDRQTIRLVATVDEALRREGLGDAGPRTFVAATPAPGSDMDFSVVLIQRRPFSPDELRAARLLCGILGYRVAWSPDGGAVESPFREYFASPNRAQWLADYPFRIEPTTDDAPFFFEHTRLAHLLHARDQILGAASGQLVLLVSALLVGLLGAAILALARRDAQSPPLARGDRVYFVALGVAYLAVETAMIPRVTQFLGYPTYALTVVLSALLVGSGVGSALSARLPLTPQRAAAASAVTVGVVALGLPRVLALAARASLDARIALAATLVGLVGLVLGTPFPTGLRALPGDDEARARGALHGWVLNGVASSLAGVLALLGAIERGFTAILWAAALAYTAAALAANYERARA
jgi:hypothetical protein